jgi:hypothetical protein
VLYADPSERWRTARRRRHVRAGISNASIAQIDIARGILGDALVAQNQFSPPT